MAKKSSKRERKSHGGEDAELDLDEAALEQQLQESPFNVFLAATQIRFCYFRDTHGILGQTYGMLVLQDFEGMTPNVLARTIETVEGGGMIVLLLPDMTSLKQLYTMSMDVHARFRSEADQDAHIVARFNERFLLSLASNRNCLVVDDELDVLPLSSHVKNIQPLVLDDKEMLGDVVMDEDMKQLTQLQQEMADTPLVGSLIKCCRTLDQGRAVLQFIEAISGGSGGSLDNDGRGKNDSSSIATVALTAARGRGKSAALGLVMAGAVAYGYSNVFVTSPSPENLKTLFEFVFQGFDALGYSDQEDYEIVQSTNPVHNKAVVRVNVFRETHRQTIQYIEPNDAQKLGQCELLVIDEAAAIPLPLVKDLLGPYTTFISSTINGYEGTGRSLSLKLLDQLRKTSSTTGNTTSMNRGPRFHEIKLEEPIRYGRGDSVERWLYDLLCLDATSATPITSKCPHPSDCQLYYVNRDTLFSYHEASERFLHDMMSLYVSSHYKNTPNDLQIMSDAPQHHLFVLLGPIDENTTSLPDIYCVVQVCMEGRINRRIVQAHLARGESPSGDLIPYLVSRQFQEPEFASLSGARIVRIATHPEYQRMGYGARALELLTKYYQGDIYNLDEEEEGDDDDDEEEVEAEVESDDEEQSDGSNSLQTEVIRPRNHSQLPPLLQTLSERPHERLHYLGVSYGMTQKLYNFWKKSGFEPLYLRLTENDLTGEHTCVMLRALQSQHQHQPEDHASSLHSLLPKFTSDFRRRLLSLLAYDFRKFSPQVVLSLLDFRQDQTSPGDDTMTVQELDNLFTPYDLKRMHAYAKNLLDYHVILDLVPRLAQLYFSGRLPFLISYTQAAILSSLGLQHKRIESLYRDLKLESNQTLALFNKLVRKAVKYLRQLDAQRFIPSNQEQPLPSNLSKSNAIEDGDDMSVENDVEDDSDDSDDGDESDNDQEEVNGKHSDAILSLFEEPLEGAPESSKKRKRTEKDSEEPEQRQRKVKKASTNPLVQEIMRDSDRYSLVGIQGKQLADAELDESSGTLSISKTRDSSSAHMRKGRRQMEQIEKERKAAKYKTGGRKKRKFKE